MNKYTETVLAVLKNREELKRRLHQKFGHVLINENITPDYIEKLDAEDREWAERWIAGFESPQEKKA